MVFVPESAVVAVSGGVPRFSRGGVSRGWVVVAVLLVASGVRGSSGLKRPLQRVQRIQSAGAGDWHCLVFMSA
jgi:hypothetical protein